jgi:site-specific DNA-methyltransferase (adenine-specific)
MLEINKTYLGDCLEIMKDIDNKSIDLILCDLPYGTTQCKWDVIVPFDKLWQQYERIIKDNGAILLFAQTPFDKVLGCSNLPLLRYEWIYEKGTATGSLNSKKMPMKAHENILVFYKNLPTYNPQKTYNHKPVNSNFKTAAVYNKSPIYGKVNKDIKGGGNTDRLPRSVIKFSTDTQKNRKKEFNFPTQKPVALCEYLIKTYSNEGNLVLDNCAGSGTTGIAAINTNRNYIMIENNENHFNLINKRIEETLTK